MYLYFKIIYPYIYYMERDDHSVASEQTGNLPEVSERAQIITRIMRLARKYSRRLEPVLAPYKLNTAEFEVLSALRRKGEPFSMMPSQLFHALLISSGAMTNRVDRLEREGLVKRTHDLTDRRGVRVTLTRKGRNLIEKVMGPYVRSQEALLHEFGQQDLDQFNLLLGKLESYSDS